ncbi:H-N-H-endonuclease F-TflVI [Yersinia phage phiR2-01]|uniref:H-N-H-endonuclease F-TflVI n=1 Tax=Yersinia phage phiR2-01 TaxID=1206557 RepID=I7LH08_9CAUD|nr:H-N-H-endonuclease F-TflVI [Yersinia phage phiR2-01]CCI88519.1 H-N-H-endonuclease F-TflVI [Yersinia phage phiR2-01]
MKITQDVIKSLFDYDKDTGDLIWRSRNPDSGGFNKKFAGKPAGSISKSNGYKRVIIFGTEYKIHRLVYLWHTGTMPEEIDHKDLDRANSRIENLRPSNSTLNNANKSIRKDNSSGHKNIRQRNGKWQVQIFKEGKSYSGTRSTIEEAIEFRDQLSKELFGEFSRNE